MIQPRLDEMLIVAADVARRGGSLRELQVAARRGEVVRLRRGVYVAAEPWRELDGRARHVLRVKAILRHVGPDAVVAGTSAAAVWGIPIVGDWPSEVSLLETPRSGGKSEPGVRRTSAGAANATIGEFDGMRVTSLARTALDLARRLDLPDAVATLDWTRWRRNDRRITADDLRHEWQAAHFRTGSAHLERAIAWSTDLSDSFGESRGRVAIRLLGFPEPELQRRFVDAEGAMEADYYFDDADIAGEFDGKIKYTRRDLTNGDPSAVVWREKLRQDRLRRLVSGVFRIVDADLTNPTRLARILLDAGVRRR